MWMATVAFGLTAVAVPEIPEGWQWNTQRPFQGITVTASSEQADQWPASKAIDGITAEPEGLWQTLRDNPTAAWLELSLERPRKIKGVRIFHQHEAGYYRSIDYSIACWVNGAWQAVAEVTDNKHTGWRDHDFEAFETDKVRIDIAKSEHGYRMGLNEVELVYALNPQSPESPRFVMNEPHCCGPVAEMGEIAFDLRQPAGTSVALSTRTAPDASGQPGAWSEWSPPYTESPAAIASPAGEWIQCRAAFTDAADAEAVVESMRLGWPTCAGRVELGALLPKPGEPLPITVHFSRPMDAASSVVADVTLPGGDIQTLTAGAWSDDGRTWRFEPVAPGAEEGLGRLVVGAARTVSRAPMLPYTMPLAIGTKPLTDRLKDLVEWTLGHPHKAIFVEGYNKRTMLGLYEITGDQRYLDAVREWAAWLLEYQRPEGYWPTGYGDVYFADTGSALGLLINFYKFATPEEQAAIDTALQRYADLLLERGDTQGRPFVHEDGSLGVGFRADQEGHVTGDLNAPYTISTALTGAEIFGAMYYMTGVERYKEIAVKACDWLLGTMAPSGQIPYYIDDWNPGRQNQSMAWEEWPYDTAAYAGEGFVAAWIYIDDPVFRADLGRRVRPHIEWLLETQNADGSWAKKDSGDQLRSHGLVNLLLWYHEHVEADPRIVAAVQRWYLLILDEAGSAYLRAPGEGIASSLVGRALVELVKPGVDCYRWR